MFLLYIQFQTKWLNTFKRRKVFSAENEFGTVGPVRIYFYRVSQKE